MPCHSKFDTEAIAQLFVPHSQRKRERKEAGKDRKAYNEKVWTKILRLEKVNAKMKNAGFSFHHEITTDGVAVSLLYSKVNYVHTTRKGERIETWMKVRLWLLKIMVVAPQEREWVWILEKDEYSPWSVKRARH